MSQEANNPPPTPPTQPHPSQAHTVHTVLSVDLIVLKIVLAPFRHLYQSYYFKMQQSRMFFGVSIFDIDKMKL